MRNIVDNIKEKTIMLRERINSNVILKNCIINFAFMVLFLLLGPVFEENDDVGIERIASVFLSSICITLHGVSSTCNTLLSYMHLCIRS